MSQRKCMQLQVRSKQISARWHRDKLWFLANVCACESSIVLLAVRFLCLSVVLRIVLCLQLALVTAGSFL